MERRIQPELLDSLAPTDPEAVRNRRDLRWTNAVMRNHAWVERVVRRLVHPRETVLEVGAGTGELARRLIGHGYAVDALDLWPEPPGWPRPRTWHRADLRGFGHWSDYPAIVGNLIFHQFEPHELRKLGDDLRSARVIIACEPARRRIWQWAYATFAPLFGANHVSLHDAHVSIRAGFRRGELPRLLGLSAAAWTWSERSTWLGAHRFVALRRV